jgi:hypothetical protein
VPWPGLWPGSLPRIVRCESEAWGDGLAGPDCHEEIIQSQKVQARHGCICAKEMDRGCAVRGREAKSREWVPMAKHASRRVMETETALSLGEARQCIEMPGDGCRRQPAVLRTASFCKGESRLCQSSSIALECHEAGKKVTAARDHHGTMGEKKLVSSACCSMRAARSRAASLIVSPAGTLRAWVSGDSLINGRNLCRDDGLHADLVKLGDEARHVLVGSV